MLQRARVGEVASRARPPGARSAEGCGVQPESCVPRSIGLSGLQEGALGQCQGAWFPGVRKEASTVPGSRSQASDWNKVGGLRASEANPSECRTGRRRGDKPDKRELERDVAGRAQAWGRRCGCGGICLGVVIHAPDKLDHFDPHPQASFAFIPGTYTFPFP